MKKLSHLKKLLLYLYIYIFHVICQDFVNIENHAYWQKLFSYELRLQETPGTISRFDFWYQVMTHESFIYFGTHESDSL